MAKQLILMVDNHPDFLNTRSEYLEQAGYNVIKAASAKDARTLAESARPDLAILDVRLVDDNDEHDTTGIFLAESLRQLCPVIFLTDFPTYQLVRQSLKPDETGRSLAVDFVDKRDGSSTLIATVQRVLQSQHARKNVRLPSWLNWSMVRVVLFAVLSVTIVITVLLARSDENTAVIVGIVLAALQLIVAIGTWFFEKRS